MCLDLDILTYRKLIRFALVDGKERMEPMLATVQKLTQKEPEMLPTTQN